MKHETNLRYNLIAHYCSTRSTNNVYCLQHTQERAGVVGIHINPNIIINPLSPHDALKHHFTSLKTDLIFLQPRVYEDNNGKFRLERVN